MLRTRYRSDFVQNLKEKNGGPKEQIDEMDEIRLSEWKLAVYALFFSLCVIAVKVFSANRKALYKLVFEDKLLSYETVEENGQVMLHFVRSTVMRSSPILFPLFCGFLMTLFTWIMVYLDSSVPGVRPPTPFSPEKYKVQSGHVFHMGYVIAIANGILVFLFMIINRQEIL